MLKYWGKIISILVMVALISSSGFTSVYASTVSEAVTINLNSNTGAVDYKANGILHGVNESSPSDATIAAIKPSSFRMSDEWSTIAAQDRMVNLDTQ